jgi:orotidine-5'-phosphate decarboxylase
MPTNPADVLAHAIDRAGSPVCVGLDPVSEALAPELRARHHEPLAAIAEFSRGVIKAIADTVPAIKVQSACFERYGSKGVALLEEVCADARARGLVVVLDFKRGDIGISAAHYAAAAVHAGAHWVTVSGYLGPSGVTPFLDAGLGAFVLVRTSNPDSDLVQSHALTDGRTVAGMMADHVRALGEGHTGERGLSSVGAVVGATKAGEGAMLRARLPGAIFLVPGYGAQGGTPGDVRALRRQGQTSPSAGGVLVTASRSVIFAKPEGSLAGLAWDARVAHAARNLAAEIRSVVTGGVDDEA